MQMAVLEHTSIPSPSNIPGPSNYPLKRISSTMYWGQNPFSREFSGFRYAAPSLENSVWAIPMARPCSILVHLGGSIVQMLIVVHVTWHQT